MNASGVTMLAAALLIAAPALAQNPVPVARQNQDKQSARVEQSSQSERLNRREATKLHGDQQAITGEKKVAKTDGAMSAHDRRNLQHHKHVSADVDKQKSDAQKRQKAP